MTRIIHARTSTKRTAQIRLRRIFRGLDGKKRIPIRRVTRIRRRTAGMYGFTGLGMGSSFSIIGDLQILLMEERGQKE